ncbi:MAG TPA: response regulator [Pyrinomonadaceae bacterium]
MDGKEGADRTILVVEDHDDTRALLRRLLEHHGYGVAEASDGRRAVEAVRLRCPDLILMDLHLPLLDGEGATRLIRELSGVCPVPIIAVTALDAEEHRRRAVLAGCNEYVEKPPDPELLLAKIATLLEAGRAARLAERMAAAMHAG